MEAINYIKKYYKSYMGEINNNIYDEEGRNYKFYEIYYLNDNYGFNKIMNDYYNYINKTIIKISEFESYCYNNYRYKFYHNEIYKIDLIITKEFKNLKEIIYDERSYFCPHILK